MPTTNQTHYTVTMLHVENLYVEVNVCNTVTRPSHLGNTVMEGVVADTETPFALLPDTVPSKKII